MCSDIHPKWDNNINKNTRKLVVGTMPPNFVIEKNDKKMKLYYFYGSKYNMFWNICNSVNNIEFNNSDDCINFLKSKNIGIIDVIKTCNRKKDNAADANIIPVEYENILDILYKYPQIDKIYCTSQMAEKEFIKLLSSELREKFIYDPETRKSKLKLNRLDDKEVIRLYSPCRIVYNKYCKNELYMPLYEDLFL